VVEETIAVRAEPPSVDVTLLVCTFNRSSDLRDLLHTALTQDTGVCTYEVLVVDNNSTDDTREVVQSLIAEGHSNLRYIFEGMPGKSHALNTGLAASRGAIYTIADDDFLLPQDCVRRIAEAFREWPAVSFISGKVLPRWLGTVPAWLGCEHWSAIALVDYGDEIFDIDQQHVVCLLACSFRRAHVQAIGGYRVGLSVSKDRIGGVEDMDLFQRLCRAGRRGIYLPEIAFEHKVRANRLTRSYHRRWHLGHGRFYAAMRDSGFEASSAELFGVPAHLYREAGSSAAGWLACRLLGRFNRSVWHETRLCFAVGFFLERFGEARAPGARGAFVTLSALVRALVVRKAAHLGLRRG
jgi:glucosyl-dolichyl phosphate glucuronosyltransferase